MGVIKTFVLKIKKLLQDIGGVYRITTDAAQGKIKISGTIDPQTFLMLLEKNGNKSEPKSPVNNYHGIDDNVVVQLQKISEIKGLKSVELTRDGVNITFKEDYESVQDFDGSESRRKAMYEKYDYELEMNNDGHFRGNHEFGLSTNQAMAKHYCDGRVRSTNCTCMTSHGSVSTGIPLPGYFPSRPQPEVMPEYYPISPAGSVSTGIPCPGYFPLAPPSPVVVPYPALHGRNSTGNTWQGYFPLTSPEMVPEYYQLPTLLPEDMTYNHPIFSTFSDDNPVSCVIM